MLPEDLMLCMDLDVPTLNALRCTSRQWRDVHFVPGVHTVPLPAAAGGRVKHIVQ